MARLKGRVEKLETELNRWRSGETVKVEEQVNLLDDATTPVAAMEESTIETNSLGTIYREVVCFE